MSEQDPQKFSQYEYVVFVALRAGEITEAKARELTFKSRETFPVWYREMAARFGDRPLVELIDEANDNLTRRLAEAESKIDTLHELHDQAIARYREAEARYHPDRIAALERVADVLRDNYRGLVLCEEWTHQEMAEIEAIRNLDAIERALGGEGCRIRAAVDAVKALDALDGKGASDA
jgi:hypothetical protein